MNITSSPHNQYNSLPAPSSDIKTYHEIATLYNEHLSALWNALKPEERIFAYYMVRASLPGNRIYADQVHRHALALIDLFQSLISHKTLIRLTDATITKQFIEQAETFLIYLYAHHGQYFLKEFEDHKRTPHTMGLTALTKDSLIAALTTIGIDNADQKLTALSDSLFNEHIEPTLTVSGSIEKSAGNFYSADFTEDDFMSLPLHERAALNNYLWVDTTTGKRIARSAVYKIGGKYSAELEVAHHWLTKARNFSANHPDIFDKHIPASLDHMLRYVTSGNEEDFRLFSIEWLKTHSRIDFNFGFVEVYQDPKKYRGSFEADVTIKVVDMATINALLPALEAQLPFPTEFMRANIHDVTALPNASVNAKLFGSGDAGPVRITAAYCLPNYNDIRSQYGSKQIIYQQGKGLGQLLNPELALRLFMCKKHADWLAVNDPQGTLHNDLWDILTLLHETLGHGSGKLAYHTFVEGDPLLIDGVPYHIGQTLQLNKTNINEFIGKYSDGLEELRAEIISLYTSIFNFDQLAHAGVFKQWPERIGKDKLIEWFIVHMAQQGLRRLLSQKEGATEIVQAHAQANTAILHYLLDHGGLELVQETYCHQNVAYRVIDVVLTNKSQAINAIKDLTIEVQRIKSTADGFALDELMKRYGSCVRNPEFIKILKTNRQAIQGNLKEVAEIFPRLIPVYSTEGTLSDVKAEWPVDFLSQQFEYNKLMMSLED
jgi:dipeptidyl-peptidase-3